jgi:hypothetical protein
MTPPAITFAGQGAKSGHRRTVRKRSAPTAPRRVSGPATGRAAAAGDRGASAGTAAKTVARPATGRVTRPATRQAPRPTAPPRPTAEPRPTTAPRRTTAPRSTTAPRPTRARRAAARARPTGSLPARAVAFVRALPDHSLLDRVVRGRAWIPILGVMLAGIVAMQVEVLKLGASVGSSLTLTSTLQSRNQLLRASVATLADDQRIERLAGQMGMVMPPPTAAVFLSPGAGAAANAPRAISNIHQPDQSTFLATLPVTPSGGATLASSTTGQPDSTGGTSTDSGATTGGSGLTTPVATTPTTPTTGGAAPGTVSPTAPATTTDTGAAGTTSTGVDPTGVDPTGGATGDTADSSGASTTGGVGAAPLTSSNGGSSTGG